MKKADVYIIGAVLLLAALGFAIFVINSARTGAVYVEVYAFGELEHRIPLQSGQNDILIENRDGGYNLIRITEDGVHIAKANCRNQICVQAGQHARPGQIIACLPNRVLIRLTGSMEEEGVDAVAR